MQDWKKDFLLKEMKDIGKRAKEQREKLGFSQTKIALACGITQQAYEKLESGKVHRPRYILELADILQIPAKYLLTGEEAYLSPPAQVPLENNAVTGKKIAIYSYTPSADNGRMIDWERDAPIDWVAHFPGLENAAHPAGLYVQGDAVNPCYKGGCTVFINRDKHPAEDRNCAYESDGKLHISRYLRRDNEHYYFMDPNAKAENKVSRAKVKSIYAIAGVLYG